MNLIYTKTLLYAYPHLMAIAEQIDSLVEKKALNSLWNYKPAITQYEEVLRLTFEKEFVLVLKKILDKALEGFSEDDFRYLKFKYFGEDKKRYSVELKTNTRRYYRKQKTLAEKLTKKLASVGYGEEFFRERFLQIEFFNQLLKRTEARESLIEELDFGRGRLNYDS